jgi:hypothetical protein
LVERGGSGVEEAIRIKEVVGVEPGDVFAEEGGEVVEFAREADGGWKLRRELSQCFGGLLVALEFAEHQAELLGKPGQAGAGAEQFEVVAFSGKESPQDHDAAFLVEHRGGRFAQLSKSEMSEPFEGKDAEAAVADYGVIGKELAFELVGGLFGGDEDERRSFLGSGECGTDFGQATEGFSAAGGA